jgi:hypothetical protein
MLDIRLQQPYLWSMTFDTEETPTARLQNPLAGPTTPPRAPMFLCSRIAPMLAGVVALRVWSPDCPGHRVWPDELPTRPGDSVLCVLQGAA